MQTIARGLLVVLLAAGCQPATSSPPASTSASSTVSGSRIWFAPLPANRGPTGTVLLPQHGSADYQDLFAPGAPWGRAAARIQVFKLYAPFLEHSASDSELRALFADLNRRGIALAWEAGPLTPRPSEGNSNLTDKCGRGIEGFGGAVNLTTARRIKALGGNLRFVALDEPFGFGSLYRGPNACHWSATEVARQIVDATESLKAIFPKLVVGDIESDHASVADLESWIETYHAVSGAYFPFLHLDVDWQASDWAQRSMAIETYVRGRGIRFGLIYNGGSAADTTDLAWINAARDHMAIFEMRYGGRPDDVILQSWDDHPHRVLPETDPTAFTALINRYFDRRTSLGLDFGPGTYGAIQVTGRLSDQSGVPIAAAPVIFSLAPTAGPGAYAEYTLTGAVPAGINQALIQIDLEAWAGGQGPIDVDLYQVSYRQAGDERQRVPNGNFAQGLANWLISEAASPIASLGTSDRGGHLLHLTAGGPTARAYVNSIAFPVTPGATYTVTFAARVSPASRASGQFVLILGDPEQSRRSIAFSSPALTHSGTTDIAGRATWDLGGLYSAGVEIEGMYPGDESHWPAFGGVRAMPQAD